MFRNDTRWRQPKCGTNITLRHYVYIEFVCSVCLQWIDKMRGSGGQCIHKLFAKIEDYVQLRISMHGHWASTIRLYHTSLEHEGVGFVAVIHKLEHKNINYLSTNVRRHYERPEITTMWSSMRINRCLQDNCFCWRQSTYYRQQASVGDHWEDEDDKLMV